MAGSFKHVVTKKGKLRSPEKIASMLENSGDVYEAIEEMYGMIWTLANDIANEQSGTAANPMLYVNGAMARYREGLEIAEREIH